jgi:Spy/CpxP family protein refolding chaperone
MAKKLAVVLGVMVVSALVFSLVVLASPPGYGFRGGPGYGFMGGMGRMGFGPGRGMGYGYRAIPNLTKEQETKIDELALSFQKKTDEIADKLYDRRYELSKLTDNYTANKDAIRAKLSEIKGLETDLELAGIEHWSEISKVLTPEQREYLGPRGGFGPMMGSRGGFGPGMMRGYR